MDSLEASLAELQALSIFSGFDRQNILKLCHGGKVCYTKHRESLFKGGDDATFFGVLISGAYKLTKSSPLGEEIIVHFAIPGDVVAIFMMSQPDSKFPITATAMGASRFLKIPRENFMQSWRNNPELIFKIQSALSKRMMQLQDDKMLIKAPLSQKLASLLLNLLQKSPQQDQGIIPIQLTRKEIADNLGASVESIIRIMSDWSKKGFLETNDKQIRILKVDHLIEEYSREP